MASSATYRTRMRKITGNSGTDVITSEVVHGFEVGEKVQFVQLAGGSGLSGRALGASFDPTVYFVIASGLTDKAFKVSATRGGSAVNFTTNITGGYVRRYDRRP